MSINPGFMPMTMGGGYNSLVAGLAPLLWYRMDEAATPAVNRGSLGSAANGTVANMGAFQQAGPNAIIPLAYDYNGTTSIITVPVTAGMESASFTVACLVNPDNAGEGSVGYFVELNTAAAASQFFLFFNSALTSIQARIYNTGATNFNTNTTTGISAGVWTWVFAQFNAATGLCRLWKSVSGILTEFAYSVNPALTGTARQAGRGYVGTNVTGAGTQDGKYAQFMQFGSLLSTADMQSIITLSGVT